MDLKKEWFKKSEAAPALYSEVELLDVTDFVRHNHFLKRRSENERRIRIPTTRSRDSVEEKVVGSKVNCAFIVHREKCQVLVER